MRVAALAGACAIGFFALPVAAQDLSPDDVFARARAVATARTMPPFVQYRVDFTFERKGKVQAEHERVTIRTNDGRTYLEPIPDSPRDRIDVTPKVSSGPPLIWPNRTFGLARAVSKADTSPSIFDASATPAPAAEASSAPVIGKVTAVAREYDVTLAGVETIDASSVYHLLLTPRFDPEKNRLREIWVDAATFETRRERIEITARMGPIGSHPRATIDYAPFASTYLMTRAYGEFTARFAFFSISGTGTVTFSDYGVPTDTEPWMFDRVLLAEHRKAMTH